VKWRGDNQEWQAGVTIRGDKERFLRFFQEIMTISDEELCRVLMALFHFN
jgi:hypothetical protein